MMDIIKILHIDITGIRGVISLPTSPVWHKEADRPLTLVLQLDVGHCEAKSGREIQWRSNEGPTFDICV